MSLTWKQFALCSIHHLSLKKRLLLLFLLIMLVYLSLNLRDLLASSSSSMTCQYTSLDVNDISEKSLSYFAKTFDEDNDDLFPLVYEITLKTRRKTFCTKRQQARIVALKYRDIWKFYKNSKNYTKPRKLIYIATSFVEVNFLKHYYFPDLGNGTFTKYFCPVNSCHVTNDKSKIIGADALLFHARDFDIRKVPSARRTDQIYVLNSMEPPWLETTHFGRFNGFFNWTMSYRADSDVVVKYGFVGKTLNKKIKLKKISKTRLIKRFLEQDNTAAWYVNNGCTDSNREGYVAELIKYYPIKILSDGDVRKCTPPGTKRCYEYIAQNYKFYLSFENALCRGYVTEKLFDVLDYDIVPVVFGGADYNEIVPPNSVINAKDFKGPHELAKYLWKVSNNYTLYSSFFEWKKSYRTYLYPWMCDLCQKLHQTDINTVSIKTNLNEWWSENGSCHKWTKDGFKHSDDVQNFPCYEKKAVFRFEKNYNYTQYTV